MNIKEKQNLVINFVQKTCYILGIEKKLNVVFQDGMFFKSNDVNALIDAKTWEILFNLNWMEEAGSLDVVLACFHEVRHAYQMLNVMGILKTESDDRIATWKHDFDNYFIPDSKESIENDIFLHFDVEIDAISFACYMMDKMFNVEAYIPEITRNLIEERMKEIKDKWQ